MRELLSQKAAIASVGKFHGLGNRVRAVLSSELLAQSESRAFAYTWPTGSQFEALFTQLWEYDGLQVSATLSRVLALRVPYRDNTLTWLNDDTRKERLWQIKTPHALKLPEPLAWEARLQTLQPVAEVRERVAKIFYPMFATRPYIGVMVRAHENSHEQTRQYSPVEWYLRRMHEIRRLWPEVGFFVSADTTNAFDQILKEFPDSVSQKAKGAFNSKQALISSVADLYLLASSSHILAPHYSSFPELAMHLAGPGLRLETSRNAAKLEALEGTTSVTDPLQPSQRRKL